MNEHRLTDPEKIVIRKEGMQIFVLSRYSAGRNAAMRFIEGNENCYFLPEDAPLEAIYAGKVFAQCWDNLGPFFTGKHRTIGANHGSPFAFRVRMLRHWLFESDIGRVFTDDAGERFVLVSVDSSSQFTLHSDLPDGDAPFCSKITGSLHLGGRTFLPESVRKGQLEPAPGRQLSPHRRYNRVRLLADGSRELKDGETAECSFAELHWDVDLILPDALLDHLKKHPGKYVSSADPCLQPAVRSREIVTFLPRCARTVDCEFTFLQDFPEPMRCGLVQFYNEVKYPRHERFVPGVKTVTADGMEISLAEGFRFPEKFTGDHYYTRADCLDPDRLPCRYIDFYGNELERELGVALGYSPTQGISARGNEAQRGNIMMHLCPSTKSYPSVFERPRIEAGEKYRIYAYQQYFLPDPAGVSCYRHQEADGFWVYADFFAAHAGFELELPVRLAGKNIEVMECSPGIAVSGNSQRIPENGILSLRSEGKGGIVLRIR